MPADRIRVAVAGYRGKVGSVLAAAFQSEPGIEYVGGVELGDDLAAFLHDKRPRALVDFTKPSEALHNALAAVAAGASPVIGTTGLGAAAVDKLETACKSKGVGGIVAPNFAVGAVLMMHLADIAAPHFDAVEVIEMHHATKLDAPSGTALSTAKRLAARRREKPSPMPRQCSRWSTRRTANASAPQTSPRSKARARSTASNIASKRAAAPGSGY